MTKKLPIIFKDVFRRKPILKDYVGAAPMRTNFLVLSSTYLVFHPCLYQYKIGERDKDAAKWLKSFLILLVVTLLLFSGRAPVG